MSQAQWWWAGVVATVVAAFLSDSETDREHKWLSVSQDLAHANDRYGDAIASETCHPERLARLKARVEELEMKRERYRE